MHRILDKPLPSCSVCACRPLCRNHPPTTGRPRNETDSRPPRVHQGYESWERPLPTHVKAQYAGGMGFLSFGAGWDYGRKCRWETDILIGFLPKAYSNRTHTIYTLKQNYIPWSISCCDRFAIEPLTCGVISISYRAKTIGCGNPTGIRMRNIIGLPPDCARFSISGNGLPII